MRYNVQAMIASFQPVTTVIENLGYRWAWAGFYGVAVLPASASTVRGLSVLTLMKNGSKWYLWLQDKSARLAHIYQIGDLEQAIALITATLGTHQDLSEPVQLDASIILQYNLIPLSFGNLVEAQHTAQLQQWHQFGWEEFAGAEEESVWSRIDVEFYGTTGRLPTPSMTWDLSAFEEGSDLADNELEPEFVDKVLIAMREHIEVSSFLYVMVHNTTSYRFKPHAFIPGAYRDYWAVSPLIVADMTYFLFPDFKSGLIVSWRGTISIFGERFLASVQKLAPTILLNSKVISSAE